MRTPATEARGFALMVMLLLVLALAVLGTAALMTASDDRAAAASVFESGRAFYAAEAGLSAVLETWDQAHYDTALPEPGDSTVVGWFAIENRCEYRVVVRRVDGDGDPLLYSLSSTGRTPGLRAAQRTVSMVVRTHAPLPTNAVTVNGALEISGDATFLGACADVHANGASFEVSGAVTTDGAVSGTGDVLVSGSVQDPFGNPVAETDFASPQYIPDLDPMEYCASADYFLRGGFLVDVAAGDSADILGAASNGWEYTGTVYVTSHANPVTGWICADDDVQIAHNVGSPGSPTSLTILSRGSISAPSDPFLGADHPAGILFMAAGDLAISGNPGGTANYAGLLYADGQCEVTGAPRIQGMLVCRDAANPPSSEDWVTLSRVTDDAEFTYGCAPLLDRDARPIRERAWTQGVN